VTEAPVIGHGTGSIADQFRRVVVGNTGAAAVAPANPHNQIFAVAGLLGVVVLLAMWTAHFMLFRGSGLLGRGGHGPEGAEFGVCRSAYRAGRGRQTVLVARVLDSAVFF
jgi:hypothetical protein